MSFPTPAAIIQTPSVQCSVNPPCIAPSSPKPTNPTVEGVITPFVAGTHTHENAFFSV
ncbi:hypothetical protein NEOLEDRAFT_1127285 [Neolentinus lepideus HHB14362 ss-1]|uniref:Uncharacterized protein n=1 Tax=Neolentinus lepideus HHB14362 ss-1 TaxID=1314782 RepID=A0A165VWV0_9AGAM|nr:hypothetical protein NEOLEDRAFT_1127285 [Neolentinus lepideus HHB14362 ss-1]